MKSNKILQSKRTLIVFLLFILTFTRLNASVVQIDGVNYSNESFGLAEGEVLITGINHETIAAEVVIPEKITINDVEYTVTRIAREAFAYNTTITSITLPAGLKYIDSYAFYQCQNLSDIKGFPEKLDYIGNGAFSNTQWIINLEKNAPAGFYLVGGWVLGYVGKMPETLTFPNNTIGICDNFATRLSYTYYSYVKKIVLNEGLKYINRSAFYYFLGLTEITLPASLEVIENDAFESCYNIERYTVPDENPVFSASDGVLYNKEQTKLILYPTGKNITDVVISNNVTEIAEYAFYGAQHIKSLTIPEGVTSIPNQTIREMPALETVILPSTISFFGFGIFYECNNLKSIVLYAENVPTYYGIDLSVLTETTLYVPETAINAYKADEYWSKMVNIQPIKLNTDVARIVIEDGKNDGRIYNLNGQCVSHPEQGGIYIKNGKKIINHSW